MVTAGVRTGSTGGQKAAEIRHFPDPYEGLPPTNSIKDLRALEAHPSGEDMLRDLMEHQASAAPPRICKTYCRLRERIGAASRYSLDVFEHHKHAALGLVKCAAPASAMPECR